MSEYTETDVLLLVTPGTAENRAGLALMDGLADRARKTGGPGSFLSYDDLLEWLTGCREALKRGPE